MRIAQRILIAALTITFLLGPITPVAHGANCQFTLGFKTLHDQIPAIVGDCLENEHYSWFNGDGIQKTTKGTLVWRKADNFTAFTDGYHTWILGPNGLQERLNSDRFSWEADYTMIFDITLNDLPKGYQVFPPLTGPATNDQEIRSAPDPAAERIGLQQLGRVSGYYKMFLLTAPLPSGNATSIDTGIAEYRTAAGSQTTWNEGWVTPPLGWQQVSAPTLGDQSVVFVLHAALPQPQGQHIDFVDYLVHVRVGRFLFFIHTREYSPNGSPDEAIALARIIAGRMQARR